MAPATLLSRSLAAAASSLASTSRPISSSKLAPAAEKHLAITFDEGDAEALPYGDATFDAVTTMFGAMFAPRPELVASECARVLRPGGLLAMANWNPGSFTGAMFRASSKHVPPPPGVPPPVLWGDEEIVCQRLEPWFADIKTELIPIDFDLPTDPTGAVEFFRTYFGPTRVAFSRLDETGQKSLTEDLVALWSSANIATAPDSHILIRNQYLQITAKRQ